MFTAVLPLEASNDLESNTRTSALWAPLCSRSRLRTCLKCRKRLTKMSLSSERSSLRWLLATAAQAKCADQVKGGKNPPTAERDLPIPGQNSLKATKYKELSSDSQEGTAGSASELLPSDRIKQDVVGNGAKCRKVIVSSFITI